MFETAGVARTERSIVNWCRSSQGLPRLHNYFDTNERKYYINPASVDLAIAEEKAKGAKNNPHSEPVGSLPKQPEMPEHQVNTGSEENSLMVIELRKKMHDLQLVTRVKDGIIEHLQEECDNFLDKLLEAKHKVGVLETKLLQISAPSQNSDRVTEVDFEAR
jgi:hypothetical protein